ncbi:hypothetical protein [Novosphingobium sp. SG707]|uniref:hypothetical protein n=1 Tax=Novosphingobium sp. SG707 TaxID=2586996 RepID=UPI001445BC7C|nr:hypothetical protein [Novosphingobium sp. SG707]NKI98372.1 hypothetical protein [Novosphingobium sp. SG707]
MTSQNRKGPLGDVIPSKAAPDRETSGGQKPEKVEDRPNVGQVSPEDYPEADRGRIKP